MIKTFKNRALAVLWETSKFPKIDVRLQPRILVRLDRLDVLESAEEMNIPGFGFHTLKGKPTRFTVHVNGPWCVTFEFENGDAYRVDFEQCH